MKKVILFAFAAVFSFSLTACGGGGGGDQSSPEGVVKMVFAAASSGDLSSLKDLCDPQGENDGDTRRICESADKNPDEFKEYFAKGKINGESTVEGERAEVPFLFGPDGTKEESMRVIKRGDKWYLYSF